MATPSASRSDYRGPARDAYGKPGRSYPTPVLDDFVVVRTGNLPTGQYHALPYGTPDGQFNGQNGARLALLVKQTVTPGDGTTENWTRVFATNRQNQQLWNYSLAWALNSAAHVVTTRSSLVLRSGYVNSDGSTNRAALFAPDPAFPGALLVSETAAPAEDPYGTIYLRVTQTFETIPGPVLTGEERTKIGRTVTLIPPEFLGAEDITITTQVVQPGTPSARADAVNSIGTGGGMVLSSIVTAIDAAHSQKVNITRANNPYPTLSNLGLDQGHGSAVTTTARQIVTPGTTVPDTYLTLDASTRALSADNSLLEVTTATAFPTLVAKEANSNVPAEFLANFVLTTTTSWPDTTNGVPDPDSGGGILESVLTPDGTTKRAKKVNKSLPSGATLPTLTGAEMSNEAGGQSVPVVRQIVAAGTPAHTGFGVLASAYTPLNATQGILSYSQVSSFPALAFYETGRPTEVFPGKYGSGGGGTRQGVRQIVPTGTAPSGSGSVLSRKPINAYEDEVEIGTISPSGGTGTVSGITYLPSGDLATVTWTLGGSPPAPDFTTVVSISEAAGGGQIESHVVKVASFSDLHAKRAQGAAIPERLLAGLQVFEDITYRIADGNQTPNVPTGTVGGRVVLSAEIQPHDGYVNRGKQVTRSVDLSTASKLTSKEIGRDAGGGNVTVTEQAVLSSSAMPTPTFKTLSVKHTDVGGGASIEEVRTLADGAFPILLDLVLHDNNKYGILLKEEHQDVDASEVPTSPDPPSGGICVIYEADAGNHLRATKITRTLIVPQQADIPDEEGERVMRRPFLIKNIYGFDGVSATGSLTGGKYFYYDGERSRDYVAKTRTRTSFGTGLTRNADLKAEPRGMDYIFSGESVRIDERNACYDGSFAVADASGVVFHFLASTPYTYTQYQALIGTEIIISSVVTTYEWGLQMRRDIYVTIE